MCQPVVFILAQTTVLSALRHCQHMTTAQLSHALCYDLLQLTGCSITHVAQNGSLAFLDALKLYFNCFQQPNWPKGSQVHRASLVPRIACDSLLGRRIERWHMPPPRRWVDGGLPRDRLRRSSGPLTLPSNQVGLSLAPYIVASIVESATVGSIVTPLYVVSSVPVTYRIASGNSNSQFIVNGSGVILLNKLLDFEAAQTYTLNAVAFATRSESTIKDHCGHKCSGRQRVHSKVCLQQWHESLSNNVDRKEHSPDQQTSLFLP